MDTREAAKAVRALVNGTAIGGEETVEAGVIRPTIGGHAFQVFVGDTPPRPSYWITVTSEDAA